MMHIDSKLLLKAAAIYLVTMIVLTITTVPLMNAIWCWYTNNWTPFVTGLSSFGIAYIMGSASAAFNGGISLGAAMLGDGVCTLAMGVGQ